MQMFKRISRVNRAENVRVMMWQQRSQEDAQSLQ